MSDRAVNPYVLFMPGGDVIKPAVPHLQVIQRDGKAVVTRSNDNVVNRRF